MKISNINYKEIFDAWLIARNPTPEQKQLAEKRYAICSDCEFRKPLIKNNKWSEICKECGCPLNKKIFTRIYNACPLKKWEESDSQILIKINDKDKNTII